VDNRLKIKEESPAKNSDAWVSTKVKAALLFHRNVSSMTEVNTKDGIVTLKGDATSQAQKDLTGEYAKDIDGVKDVQNEMTVSNTPGNPDKKTMGEKMGTMHESIDDASITALVKITLMYHRSTSALHTKVKTNKGLVTLSGMAGNTTEKDLATKYVQDVYGVKSVANNMTIAKSKAD
jgi:osmotically-inducible protein OsmY